MNHALEFEDPFRPIYEQTAMAVWAVTGVISLIVTLLSPYPSLPFLVFSLFCLGMAVYRGLQAHQLRRVQKAMEGNPLSFITPEELVAITADQEDALFLGYGFTWSQREAQTAFTLTRYDPERLLPRQEGQMGQPWIHGIGKLREQPIFLPISHTKGHTLILGTTGSGKTVCFRTLIYQAVAKGHACIILDPKGDLDMAEAARSACEAYGRADDFVYLHPAHPERSARIDVMKNFNRATELATRLASLISSEAGQDPFTAFGQMAMNNIIQAMLICGQKPSIAEIRRVLEGGMERLLVNTMEAYFNKVMPLPRNWRDEAKPFLNKMKQNADPTGELAKAYIEFYLKQVIREAPSGEVEGIISSYTHDASHFSKMIQSTMPVLVMLTAGTLGPLLSPDHDDPHDPRPITDFGKITRNGQVCYVGLDSLSDKMVSSAIGALLLADLASVAGDRYNFGNPEALRPVSIFVDECAEIVNPPFIQILNKGRGSQLTVYAATQSWSDMAARLGGTDQAQQVFANINNTMSLRVLDAETQKYVCESLPETVVKRIDYGQSVKNETDDPEKFSATTSESLKEETTYLIPPAMLGSLPNLEFIARLSAGRVVKGRFPILITPPKAA